MTRPRSRRLALALAASVAAAGPAGAQALFGPVVRAGPQFVSYKIDAPVDRTISQTRDHAVDRVKRRFRKPARAAPAPDPPEKPET